MGIYYLQKIKFLIKLQINSYSLNCFFWAGIENIPLKIIKKAPRYPKKFKYSLKKIIPINEDHTICKYTKQNIEA